MRFPMWAVIFSLCAATLSPVLAGKTISGLTYATRDGHALKLDLHYPDSPAPAGGYPVVISLHGGGWVIGGRTNDLWLLNSKDRKYVIASAAYRLSGSASFPAQIEDVRAATWWLIKNGGRFDLNTSRMAVAGTSAGGHLALLLAYTQSEKLATDGSPALPPGSIRAVCAIYPPTDLVSIVPPDKRGSTGNLVAKLLGGSVNDRHREADLGSPIRHVSDTTPPTYLVHGDKDRLVPLDQSQTLYDALRAANRPARLVISSGKIHGFAPAGETLRGINEFLNFQLGL